MTFKEAENFYKQDEKKYDIENNKEFLKWFKDSIKKGYHYFTDIEDLQQKIDEIVYCLYDLTTDEIAIVKGAL